MVWELLHLTNQQIEYGSFSHYPPLKIHSSYQHFALYNMFIMFINIMNLYSYIFYNACCNVTFISMIYCSHNRGIFPFALPNASLSISIFSDTLLSPI